MNFVVILILMAVAAISLIMNSMAWNRRTWFIGSLALSFSIGAMLWMHRPYYLIILFAALMLVADFMVFFFGRSLAILSAGGKEARGPTRLYCGLVILTLTCLVGGLGRAIWLMDFPALGDMGEAPELPLGDFHHFLWGTGFFFTTIMLLLLLVSALGVFFIAKKEG